MKPKLSVAVSFILGMLTVEIFHFCATIGWSQSWLFIVGMFAGIAFLIVFMYAVVE